MTREQVFQVAGVAGVDPRTVKSYAEGKRVYPLSRERIEAAIKKLKIKNGRP
jgi:DNA-binding LacI/PurR family transcriptional regulator